MNSSQGNRARRPRNPNMSHSGSNPRSGGRRDPRPSPDRPPPEASGVYSDPKYFHVLTSVLGCVVQVTVTSGQVYEGVLKSLSKENSFVLGMANPVDKDDPKRIDPKEVKEELIFTCDCVVTVTAANVDLEYATKSGFKTDAAISGKTNGSSGHKELQPWMEEAVPSEQLVSLEEANGWDPREMFRMNERKYGVRSTFDHSLAGYTTQLERSSHDQHERAARIAQEIERSAASRHRAEAENGDEEAAFSAVVRPDGARGDRYVPPARRPSREVVRGGGGGGGGPRGPPPSQPRMRVGSAGPPPPGRQVHGHRPGSGRALARDGRDERPERSDRPDRPDRVSESGSDQGGREASPQQQQREGRPGAAPRGPSKTIAELKDFKENFVLSEEPARPEPAPGKAREPAAKEPKSASPARRPEPAAAKSPTPTASPAPAASPGSSGVPASPADPPTTASTPPTTGPSGSSAAGSPQEVGKLADSLGKSKLNPNAKAFTMNPNAKAFTPSGSVSSASSVGFSPEPPPPPPAPGRAMTPQAPLPAGQLSLIPTPTGHPGIGYIMGPQSFPVQHQQLMPQPPRLQKQRGDYGGMPMPHRPDASPRPPWEVIGQPLMTPSPLGGHPGSQQVGVPVPGLPQNNMVGPHPGYPGQQVMVRMMPTAPASMYYPQQPQQPPQQHQGPLPGQPAPPGPPAAAYDSAAAGQPPYQTLAYGVAGSAPGQLMYQLAAPGGPYPPTSMYLVPGPVPAGVPAGVPGPGAVPAPAGAPQFAMMQPQYSGPATATSSSLPMTMPLAAQQYYYQPPQHVHPQPQQPQQQPYGPGGSHPVPLVPHPAP